MKKYSDYFSGLNRTLHQVGKRIATTALLMAAVTLGFAQDFTFIEGSIHSFSVENHVDNSFQWSFVDDNFVAFPPDYSDFFGTELNVNVTIQFIDKNRSTSEFVYLAVTETNPHGCSTTRAISIDLQPNNMYLDFASIPNADDCFNYDDNYLADVQVGMNFLDRNGATDGAIPEDRFPLKISYTVEDKTNNPGVIIPGNSGLDVEFAFSADNIYTLEIAEAKGYENETVEYELAITSVIDNYGTAITHDENRRVQIRVIKHLPQSGTMDMAMAYVITPINYLGGI